MAEEITLIICTESGPLEPMSSLFVESLRTFGGRYADVRVVSFRPRPGPQLSRKTQKRFAELNVECIDKVLNDRWRDYPLANKPLACAYAEEHFESDVVAFFDSDQVILNEPTMFKLEADSDVAIAPVYKRGVGTNYRGDKNQAYWDGLRKICGEGEVRFVCPQSESEPILEYYNSGMIIARRSAGLMHAWRDNFVRVWESGLCPIEGRFFIEQSVFSASVGGLGLRRTLLSIENNYPMNYNHELVQGDRRLDSIINGHYHKLFSSRGAQHPLERVGMWQPEDEKARWLRNALHRHGVYHDYPLEWMSGSRRLGQKAIWKLKRKLC